MERGTAACWLQVDLLVEYLVVWPLLWLWRRLQLIWRKTPTAALTRAASATAGLQLTQGANIGAHVLSNGALHARQEGIRRAPASHAACALTACSAEAFRTFQIACCTLDFPVMFRTRYKRSVPHLACLHVPFRLRRTAAGACAQGDKGTVRGT
jgi:hypothetical protein